MGPHSPAGALKRSLHGAPGGPVRVAPAAVSRWTVAGLWHPRLVPAVGAPPPGARPPGAAGRGVGGAGGAGMAAADHGCGVPIRAGQQVQDQKTVSRGSGLEK